MDHLPRLMRMIRHAQDGGTTGGGEGTGTTDGNAGGTQAPAPQTGDSGSSTSTGNENSERTFTQADLDRAATKAAQTREKALREEFNRKQAEKDQDFQKLYQDAEARAAALELSQATTQMLAKHNLSSLAPMFSEDLSSIDGREAVAKSLNKQINAEVERRVNERLKTDSPPKSSEVAADTPLGKEPDPNWKENRKRFGIQ